MHECMLACGDLYSLVDVGYHAPHVHFNPPEAGRDCSCSTSLRKSVLKQMGVRSKCRGRSNADATKGTRRADATPGVFVFRSKGLPRNLRGKLGEKTLRQSVV